MVFGELALTPFFPHWLSEGDELDQYYESEIPNSSVIRLFDRARDLTVAFTIGYAERDPNGRRFNSSVFVDPSGDIIGRFRKVHLPGYFEPRPDDPFENLEKRYFEPGDLGFSVWNALGGRVGMCICNDRRWPETYRVMGLQGVELITLGYNTPMSYPAMSEADYLTPFHNHLVMQANAYANGTWVAAAARGGTEEGVSQLAQSCIIAPSGEIVAMAAESEDEVLFHEIDLDACNIYKKFIFNMRAHRRPDQYGLITAPAEDAWNSGDIV